MPASMRVCIERPAISATFWMVSGFSRIQKRHGWLLKWLGAALAASIKRRWCSSEILSGLKGPLVVRLERMALCKLE